jgi:hypothetical protein
MKSVTRIGAAAFCVVSLSTCNFLNKAASGNLTAADALQAGLEINAIIDEAKKESAPCDKLATRPVPWQEERAIGGAMAVGFGQHAGTLFVDITDKDPAKLKKEVDVAEAKKGHSSIVLAPGDKNDLNSYVEVVGRNLAAYSNRPDIAWTFGVIENPTANALSAPGGYVLITTGLLQLMDNEAQLAGVLAHEIGHIANKHALKLYAHGKSTACTVAISGMVAIERATSKGMGNSGLPDDWVKSSEFGKMMVKFKNGDADLDRDPDSSAKFMVWFTNRMIDVIEATGNAKEDEFEADKVAFELMTFAGYDNAEFDKIIEKIPDSSGVFAHHPKNKERIEALAKLRGDYAAFAGAGKAPAFPGVFTKAVAMAKK